ncbi:MAG: DNA mismatch repair protein MutS [Candidatus Dormiibacterota bacterium]
MVAARARVRKGQRLPFHSILFEGVEKRAGLDQPKEPAYFSDLNLDQVAETLYEGREQYELKPVFYRALGDVETVQYRQDVLRDIEEGDTAGYLKAFAQQMRTMRHQLRQSEDLRHQYQREGWFLKAVDTYNAAIGRLALDLGSVGMKSRGLRAFHDYLSSYTDSAGFTTLVAEAAKVKKQLVQVQYCLTIRGSRVTVRKYDSEGDYGADVLATFERFKQGEVKDYLVDLPQYDDMNQVEARILDLVVRLFADVFAALDEFCLQHREYLDETIRVFDREVQFYLAYADHMRPLKAAGLQFCYPLVSTSSKDVMARDTFDLALANKLVPKKLEVVPNDLYLRDPEKIFVVSGPNQGGKTTFARTFGQIHHLASVGYPVPGTEARLFLFDQLLTHFEKQEDLSDLRGRLEDDVVRIQGILRMATASSIIIMNEVFTSATVKDARLLGTSVIERVTERGSLCVYVTFIDELSVLNDATVSIVSTVLPDKPAERTYKLVRRPADGLAYAAAIAEEYGLTYDRLKGRISR